MFKIESYIAPLLLGYIDKYVKLKHEDFQVSLWGGDVVLTKLDLRLHAIERALKLPITFKSGRIHELRIHVPWTKLGSEPVVITVNTIECVLRLKDSATDDQDAASTKSSGSGKASTQVRPKIQKQDEEELPPGYVQSWINSILNNVNIVVNNLIFKFVEDDIVLSLNVKSAEVYSVDQDWKRAFIELAAPELCLRRVVDFNDLTVCLDKRNASGKIETYQDPLLYRCSVTCRIMFSYDSLHAKAASITKFNVFCEKLDLSLTDTQVPMYFRLVELCLALYYGTLELPSGAGREGSLATGNIKEPDTEEIHPGSGQDDSPGGSTALDEDQQGWASWAWSYVPQILPENEMEDEEFGTGGQKRNAEPPILALGCYCKEASVVFKLSETTQESAYYGPGRVNFIPCMRWEVEGINMETIFRGLVFFNVQIGMSSTRIVNLGEAICGVKDLQNTMRDPVFFRSLLPLLETKPVNYLTDSLFDPSGLENRGEKAKFIVDADQHMELYTEAYVSEKFGAFYMDYLYTMEMTEDKAAGGSKSSATSQSEEEGDNMKENSGLRAIVCPAHLMVHSSMVQRFHKFLHCMNDHEYEPYSKPQKEIVDETRQPPTDDEVKKLEEFIATRSYHLTLLKPTVCLQVNDLPEYDVKKKRVVSHRKLKKMSKSKDNDPNQKPALDPTIPLPTLVFQAERLDLQVTSAMYPRKVVKKVSKMAAPSSNLLHHCHSHFYFKVFGAQAGLTYIVPAKPAVPTQNLVQPWSGVFYKKTLLLPMYWKHCLQPKVEYMYELPQLTINFTKAQLMLVAHVAMTWMEVKPAPAKLLTTSLIEDIFTVPSGQGRGGHLVLQASMTGLEVRQCDAEAVKAASGTLASMCVLLVSREGSQDSITPLMYAPSDSNQLYSTKFFQQSPGGSTVPEAPSAECITFTLQFPKNAEMPQGPAAMFLTVKSMLGSLDPLFYDWLTYTPSQKLKQGLATLTVGEADSKVKVIDSSLAEAASPLKDKPPSQGSQSGSTATVPTNTPSQTQSLSLTRTRSHTKSHTQEPVTPGGGAEMKEELSQQSWGQTLAQWFPLMKIVEVQIEIESSSAFIPTKHIRLTNPTTNIAQNMKQAFTAQSLPATLVICCPRVKVTSAGHKPIATEQEIPISALEQSVAGSKLPWAIHLSDCSVYTLHSPQAALYIVKPASVSATLAVSTKYNPPTSDNITSLGLCIHADMDTIDVGCSKPQMQLIYDLGLEGVKVANKLYRSFEVIQSLHSHPSTTSPSDMVPPLSYRSPTPSKPHARQDSTSSQLEPADFAAAATATETSETLSREMSPIKEVEEMAAVKLSLWLQWTLLKFVAKIYSQDKDGQDVRLSTELEDLTTSIDLQDVYSKVKCKVGAFNIHHGVKMETGSWKAGDHAGIIMSCNGQLSHSIHIQTNRPWPHGQGQPTPSVFTKEDKGVTPRDKGHGFMTLTFTRALRKNVRKRLQKANVEVAECKDKNDRGQVFLNEVCVNLEPCDMVLNCPAIANALSILSLKSPPSDLHRKQSHRSPPGGVMTSTDDDIIMPLLPASILPLIYINASNFRLFVPSCPEEKVSHSEHDLRGQDCLHDICMLQITAVSLVPQADNPLPRIVVDKDIYRRAVHAGITNMTGSEVEDRQYQLDISGLSLSTGRWSDFVMRSHHEKGLKDQTVQNPALEWNTLLSAQNQKEDIKLIPLASSFDLRVIAAPAVVHNNGYHSNGRPSLVCGYSLEMNATSDMDFFLSVNQVKVVHEIFQTNFTPLLTTLSGASTQKKKVHIERVELGRDESSFHDSGVESEASTLNTVVSRTTPARGQSQGQGQGQLLDVASSAGTGTEGYDWPKFTPFDILLTAGKISFMVYSHCDKTPNVATPSVKTKGDLELKERSPVGSSDAALGKPGEGSTRHIMPFLYAYFSQPYSLISCLSDSQKVELSCYDTVLKGTKQGHVVSVDVRQVPDTSDFTEHWIETRPGKMDPKTGVPPSLYTLTVVDFINLPADIELKFERPLKVNASLSTVQQITTFMKGASEVVVVAEAEEMAEGTTIPKIEVKSPSKSQPESTQTPTFLKHLAKVNSVHLSTVQMVVAVETNDIPECPGLQLSVSELDSEVTFKVVSEDLVEEIHKTTKIQDLLLTTRYDNRCHPFLGPVTLTSSVTAQWCQHSGSRSLPQLLVFLESGAVQVHLGQDNVLCAQLLSEQVMKYFEEQFKDTASTPKPKVKRSPSHGIKVRRSSSVAEPKVKETEIHPSTDDLRAADFEFITDENGPDVLPSPKEIVFHIDSDHGQASMSWCYPESRVISHIHVTPVPFTLPQVMDVNYIDESLKVPCILQYWNILTRQFENYGGFELSENEETVATLPEVTGYYNPEVIGSEIWRVLIQHPRDKNEDCDLIYGIHSEDGIEPVVSPLTLAASIKVDSCFIPSAVPMMQCSMSASLLQIRLSNHLKHLGKGTPAKLHPFVLDNADPTDQEFMVLTADNPTLTFTHIQGHTRRAILQGSATVQCEVTEYRNLTLNPLLEPCSVNLEVGWTAHNQKQSIKTDLLVGSVRLKVGQSVVHTLSAAAQAWNQVPRIGDPQLTRPVLHHYVICNDTQETIRLGQVDTDEGVLLKSREAHPYSWRSHRAKQCLQLCMETVGWQWCDPIDLDLCQTHVRVIQKGDQRVTLLVRIQQLNNVQKQVIIMGQVMVASRLTQNLEVKLLTNRNTRKDMASTLGANQTAASYTVEHDEIRALKLRLAGQKMAWSQEIPISVGKMKETRLVKLPLSDVSGSIHVWCHVFCQQYIKATQSLVLFTPLFVVRSQLPVPLLMNVETPRLQVTHQMELQGEGHIQQLMIGGGDLIHTVNFQLRSAVKASNPPITLSAGMIQQIPRDPVDVPSIEQLLAEKHADDIWPYNHLEQDRSVQKGQTVPSATERSSQGQDDITPSPSPSSSETKLPPVEPFQQPDIDLQVNLSQYLAGCNTLLITVAPHWLVVNEGGVNLVLIDSQDKQWQVMKDKSFVPPHFEASFRLGLELKGRVHTSLPVVLSDEDNTSRYLPAVDRLLYREGCVDLNIVVKVKKKPAKVCYLTLHSTVKHDMRVITVRERYNVTNHTEVALDVCCYTVPASTAQAHVDHSKVGHKLLKVSRSPDSPEMAPLLLWNIPSTSQSETSLPDDAGYVQYVCFRPAGQSEHSSQTPSQSDSATHWTCPVRIKSNKNGTRQNVAIPHVTDSGVFRTRMYSLMAVDRNGMAYMVLEREANPSILLHNNCDFPVHFGQTLIDNGFPDKTVYEEAELIDQLPILPPGGSSHYAFPSANTNFPDIVPLKKLPKLHLAGCPVSPGVAGSKVRWSAGIDIQSEHDVFVHIPEVSDVKAHIERVGHTAHIFLDRMSRAEVSAREIRSRIQGQEKVSVITTTTSKHSPQQEEKKEPSHDGSRDTSHDSTDQSEHQAKPHQPVKIRPQSTMTIEFDVLVKSGSLLLLDEITNPRKKSELVRMTGDKIFVSLHPKPNVDTLSMVWPHMYQNVLVCIGDLQVDNQAYAKGSFDFPVVLVKQARSLHLDFDESFLKLSSEAKVEKLKASSFLVVFLGVCSDLVEPQVYLKSADVDVKAVSLFLEDTFIYEVVKQIDKLLPSPISHDLTQPIRIRKLPQHVRLALVNLKGPIRLEHLKIQPISMLLSVHASLKLFIASDTTPLKFSGFEKHSLYTSNQQLVSSVVMHYVTGALFRAGWVVGSLEILGNPTGLLRNIGTGVSDLVRMPYEGLSQGPGAFITGVSGGMGSLLRHVSTGMLTSVTNFASSLSRNMDRLSLDTDHRERQEESRRHKPMGISDGLKNGLTGFGISLLGAVAGIADQPIQSLAHSSDAAIPTSPTQKATGLVSGVGKGLVGAVTKPIGGAAEFVSQTGLGLLQGAGLTQFPLPREPATDYSVDAFCNSNLKYLQKMLLTVPNAETLFTLDATQLDKAGEPVYISLLLTPDILFVVSQSEDSQQQAYAVSEVVCQGSGLDLGQLCVLPEFKPGKSTKHPWQDDHISSKDRVAAFIDGARTLAHYLTADGHMTKPSSQSEAKDSRSVAHEFHVDPKKRDLFIAVFNMAKNRATGMGFVL